MIVHKVSNPLLDLNPRPSDSRLLARAFTSMLEIASLHSIDFPALVASDLCRVLTAVTKNHYFDQPQVQTEQVHPTWQARNGFTFSPELPVQPNTTWPTIIEY